MRLHLEHFRGRQAASRVADDMWPGDPQTAWDRLTDTLAAHVGAAWQRWLSAQAPTPA